MKNYVKYQDYWTKDIIAFTWDADIHCIDCTVSNFEMIMKFVHPDMNGTGDFERDYENFYEDSEGNPINPVFSYDECVEQDWACGDCGVLIKEAYSDPEDLQKDLDSNGDFPPTKEESNQVGDTWEETLYSGK